jgi:hypothetical protein
MARRFSPLPIIITSFNKRNAAAIDRPLMC